MILLVAVALSVIVGLLRGGRLSRLTNVSLRYGWAALVALVVQVVIVYLPLLRSERLWGLRAFLLLGSYVLLATVVVVNRRLPGLPLVGFGLALNLLVMLANGGYMPVTLEALQQAGLAHLAQGNSDGARVLAAKDILLSRGNTRLWVLSDIFALPPPVGAVISIGDAFLASGAFVFFQRTMQPRPRESDVASDAPA